MKKSTLILKQIEKINPEELNVYLSEMTKKIMKKKIVDLSKMKRNHEKI